MRHPFDGELCAYGLLAELVITVSAESSPCGQEHTACDLHVQRIEKELMANDFMVVQFCQHACMCQLLLPRCYEWRHQMVVHILQDIVYKGVDKLRLVLAQLRQCTCKGGHIVIAALHGGLHGQRAWMIGTSLYGCKAWQK
jgi:hypothetical protein